MKASPTAPVRGTQSFVNVMAEVWKRPLLTAIELGWRWLFWLGLCCFAVLRWRLSIKPFVITLRTSGWSEEGLTTDSGIFTDLQHRVDFQKIAAPLLLAYLAWAVLSAWGRSEILRKLDRTQHRAFGPLFLLGVLRVFCLAAAFGFWFWSISALINHMIVGPQSRYQQPALVPFAALVICGTLGLFVTWMAASYVFQIAPVVCMEKQMRVLASLRYALRNAPLRSKLVEVNLVIGIVKIALLVLFMVFSACPLPFSSVETQTFLMWWWIGVAVWWTVASDFFHVVRSAAFFRLWQAYEIPHVEKTSSPENAS